MEGERNAEGIDQEMPFASFDTLVRTISTDANGLLDRLRTLGVHDGRAQVDVLAGPPTCDEVRTGWSQNWGQTDRHSKSGSGI